MRVYTLFDCHAGRRNEDAYTGHLRFDIDHLAGISVGTKDRRRSAFAKSGHRLLLFSTGGGLSRGGARDDDRCSVSAAATDLAEKANHVKAPTLLIVGERDEEVLRLNEGAYEKLQCEKSLAIVPRATHLFQEPGTLGEVARLAAEWFAKHLGPENEDAIPRSR